MNTPKLNIDHLLLDSILQKYVEASPSAKQLMAAGLVLRDRSGATIYSNAYGKLNDGDDSPPFTTESPCWVASLTKLLTAVCVMQLVEKGAVDLDDDVGKIVPDLADIKILRGFDNEGNAILVEKSKPLTLRNLLTHSSGFCYDNFDPEMIKWSTSVGRTVTSQSHSLEGFTFPLKFEPGESWMYGVSSDWAARVVEVVSNSTLEAYAQEHVFKPLGMVSSTFFISGHPELASRRAIVAFRSPLDGKLVTGDDPAPLQPKQISGGAGLFTTAQDYSNLLAALVSNDGVLIKPATVKELFRPQLRDTKDLQAFCDGPFHDAICPEFPRCLPVNYALGGAVNLEDVPGKRRKGSVMWSGYTNSHWWIDLETGIAGTLFTQVLPMVDPVVIALYDELERAVYQGITST
ncbi:uncharacterized protein Z518_00385 [Rhinocladiella mackenziei CBS 650.93]|uniref:Beta-lactamase-related domain-containing protein n=1 Tax=Rhinocladiella mackenziei CBS 650.93 TaxID=1442369 RepID=A0A0D2J0T5_9EURO|nr:uncharacterized protein Z518_00385 [Rhinocladiella mackenziei CBS 650.93]KIX09306.1 hypothetical protein Z518_00385 [Rhinocladiella mackenziei CBS 650.93]